MQTSISTASKRSVIAKILLMAVTLIVAIVLSDVIPRAGSAVASIAQPITSGFDPDNVFVLSFVHHIVQGLAAFLLIALLTVMLKKPLREFGFNLNDYKWSFQTTFKFNIGWLAFYGLAVFLLMHFTGMVTVTHPMNARNIAGYLAFMLTMPGPSEEIVFRSLPYAVLAYAWTGSLKLFGLRFSHKALITAILFTIAHIGYTLVPFQILSYNSWQLAMAFSLGIFYAYMYERTGSLLGPILCHASSDFFGLIICYILTICKIG